jgi:hypothetical protein
MTGLAIGVATGEIGQKDISLSLIRLFFMSDQLVSWSDFQKIDIRVGTIIEVDDFPKAYLILLAGAFGVYFTLLN